MKDNKFDIEELVIRYCEGNVSESEKCDVENVKSLCIRLVVMWQKVSIIIILMKIIRSVR